MSISSNKRYKSWTIKAAIRSSLLSQIQKQEVEEEMRYFFPLLRITPLLLETRGDIDQTTSLRTLEKTDFFTREVDAAVERGDADIAIHSAKDLPSFLSEHLQIAAITKGKSSEDSLVFRQGVSLKNFPRLGKVGVCSFRRERNVQAFLPGCLCVDIRGPVPKRLEMLRELDAVVVAKAALERLSYHAFAVPLPGPTPPLQGKLAVITRKEGPMRDLFACIDAKWEKDVRKDALPGSRCE